MTHGSVWWVGEQEEGRGWGGTRLQANTRIHAPASRRRAGRPSNEVRAATLLAPTGSSLSGSAAAVLSGTPRLYPNRPATDRRATTGRTWPRPALGGRPALQPTVPPNRRQRRRPNHRRSPRLSPHGTCWTACGRRRRRRVPPLEATRVGHRRCRRLTGRRVSDPLLMVELLVGGQRRPAAKRKAPSRPPSQASSFGNDQRSAPERHDLRRALATGVCLPHALHKKQTVTQPTLRSATLRTFCMDVGVRRTIPPAAPSDRRHSRRLRSFSRGEGGCSLLESPAMTGRGRARLPRLTQARAPADAVSTPGSRTLPDPRKIHRQGGQPTSLTSCGELQR